MMIAACDAGRDVPERWLDGRGGKGPGRLLPALNRKNLDTRLEESIRPLSFRARRCHPAGDDNGNHLGILTYLRKALQCGRSDMCA